MNKNNPTKITVIMDGPNGSTTVVLDVTTMSNDELLSYASMGEPAAMYELKARMQQNNRN